MPFRNERDRSGKMRRYQKPQRNPRGFAKPDATESNDAYLEDRDDERGQDDGISDVAEYWPWPRRWRRPRQR
jgi:hypothetical protein